MYRKRKHELAYNKHKLTEMDECIFCAIHTDNAGIVYEATSFWIYKNLFKYTAWDNRNVTDHVMIVPKRHILTLAELSAHEKNEYMTLLSEYDSKGYSSYLRASTNTAKTIQHLHAHLIQTEGKPHNFHLYLRKPYFLWFK